MRYLDDEIFIFKKKWMCKVCRVEFERRRARCPGCLNSRLIRIYKFKKTWQCRSCKRRYKRNVGVCPRCGEANSKKKL